MTRRKHPSDRLTNTALILYTNAYFAVHGHPFAGRVGQALAFSFERANVPIPLVRDFAAGLVTTALANAPGIG